MAVTQNSYIGTGSQTIFPFTFPYLKASDIKASLDAVDTTAFTLPTATTIQFNTAPTNGAKIKIFRETATDNLTATFYAGSAIKSEDLNENFTQNLYSTQEVTARYLSNLGGTMIGNLNLGEDADLTFEGASDNANETTLTVADPTADRTITLPDTTGTVITTGDTGTVTGTMLANSTITSADIVDGTIVNADINASADIAGTKLADDSVTLAKLGGGALPTDITIASANIVNGTIVNADIATGTLDGRYYTETELDAGQLDNRYYTETELNAGQLDTRYYTETELNAGQLDNRYYTEAEADARFYNLASSEEIQSGETWVAADNKVATTAAIDARIVDLVDDVGGFVPIANETSFPNANPDVNNGAGTLVSVPLANNLTSNSSGVISISNGTVGNSTVTIQGAPASSTFTQGFGIIVETTSSLNVYTFHRYVPKATEVTTVAGSIANVNTTAGAIANVNNVGNNIANVNAAATNETNINAAVSNATNINAAVANASNINAAVANASNINDAVGNGDNINTVAGNISNVNTVGGISGNVTTVAGISGNVTTAANNATVISTVAGSISNVNNVGGAISNVASVAASLSNVNTVAGDISNVNTVAGNNTNINTVAGNNTNITTVANNNSNITAVAGDATDIGTVAGSISNVNTTAANIANVNSVGGAISNVNTVATNLTPINTAATYLNDFQSLYLGTAASAPVQDSLGNAVTEGDLYFNTGNKQLQVYNGSVFTNIVDTAIDFAKSATAAFNALYTASAGSNSIDLGGLAISGAAFSNEAIASNRVSLTKGSATYNLGGI